MFAGLLSVGASREVVHPLLVAVGRVGEVLHRLWKVMLLETISTAGSTNMSGLRDFHQTGCAQCWHTVLGL